MKCAGREHRMFDQVDHPGIAVRDVDRDRHVEAARLVVDRIKIRIDEQPVALDRAHEHGDSAVRLAEADLIERIGYRQRRRHARPAEPPFALAPDIGEPAVVAFAERDLDGWAGLWDGTTDW